MALFCHHGTAGVQGAAILTSPSLTSQRDLFPASHHFFLRCLDRLVNAKRAVRELAAAFPGRARAARGSWRRGVPRILLVAGARPRPPARNTVSLLRCPAQDSAYINVAAWAISRASLSAWPQPGSASHQRCRAPAPLPSRSRRRQLPALSPNFGWRVVIRRNDVVDIGWTGASLHHCSA